MSKIHATAIVAKEAQIGKDAEIGPFCVIGPHVSIGAGTKLHSHVVLEGYTEIGSECEIFPFACLGQPPQDKKYTRSIRSYLRIGGHNIIREYVTMHPGSHAESETKVGDHNLFMISSHIGHDCKIGSHIVMANEVGVAGHVTIEDHVVVGGLCGIHQFVRIGKYAMIGAVSKATLDIAPFSLTAGNPCQFFGHNGIGLRRAGYASKDILIIKKVLKNLLGNGSSFSGKIEEVQREYKGHPDVEYLIEFMKNSKRGVTRSDSVDIRET